MRRKGSASVFTFGAACTRSKIGAPNSAGATVPRRQAQAPLLSCMAITIIDCPLDTSGKLPTGEQFDGATELKQLLLQRKEQYLRNLTGQLLSYAFGRELQDSDEWTIRQVVAGAEKDGYRLSALISGIVKSVPFQSRRGGKQ